MMTAHDPAPDIAPYALYAIRYATQGEERSLGETYMNGDHAATCPGLDFFMWAIVGNGRKIVVDTGFTKEKAAQLGRDHIISPVDALPKIGIDPAEVTDLIITHMHYDHMGHVADFPKARLHAQEAEMASVTGRDMTYPLLRRAYHVEDIEAMLRLVHADRVRFYNGDFEFAPGIRCHLIGGHSAGQMALTVWTKRGWTVLASDAVHLYEEMEQEKPFAIFHDLRVMLEGYRRCYDLAPSPAHIVPAHDKLVTSRYPAVKGLEGLVLALHETPKA